MAPDSKQEEASVMPPAPGASRRRKRIVLGSVAALLVVVGGGVAAVSLSGHDGEQSQFCNTVKKLERFPSASAVVSQGGHAPADIPPLPGGSIATCTVTHVRDDIPLTVFVVAYKHGTDFTAYQASVEAHGFSQANVPDGPVTEPGRTSLGDSQGRVVDLIADLDGNAVIQVFYMAP